MLYPDTPGGSCSQMAGGGENRGLGGARCLGMETVHGRPWV